LTTLLVFVSIIDTPTTNIRFGPEPTVWDHAAEVADVELVTTLLLESSVIAA
jgi:hypothetical protein